MRAAPRLRTRSEGPHPQEVLPAARRSLDRAASRRDPATPLGFAALLEHARQRLDDLRVELVRHAEVEPFQNIPCAECHRAARAREVVVRARDLDDLRAEQKTRVGVFTATAIRLVLL